MVGRRSVASFLVMALVLLAPQVASALTPTKVYDPPGYEWFPFRNASYLLFQHNSNAHPNHSDAIARDLAGGTNQKLNARGTEGGPGGFDPGTNTVIYQQWTNRSGIRMFNLDTQTQVPVPSGLNTKKWEWEPRISTAYISFFRNTRINGKWYADLFVYDRVGATLTKIARLPLSNFTENGTMGEQYATWYSCGNKTCRAYLYDVLTDTTIRIPTQNGRPQYAATVDEVHGTLFFVRSGFKCGAAVTFFTVPVATPTSTPTKLKELPRGVDVDSASLDGPDLIFSRVACGHSSGVYQLANVAT